MPNGNNGHRHEDHDCSCEDCAWHGKYVMYGHPRYMMLRWLVLILAMFVVFWLGLQIGEFKSLYGFGYYGGGPMMYRMYYMQPGNMMYQRQPNNGYGNYNNQTQSWPPMTQPQGGNNLYPQQ